MSDLEECWALVRPAARRRSPTTSLDVLTSLDRLTEVTRLSLGSAEVDEHRAHDPWMEAYRPTLESFIGWCDRHGLEVPGPSCPPTELRGHLIRLSRECDPTILDHVGLARRTCQAWWLRQVGIDLWSGLGDRDQDDWPPNLYPHRIDVPRTAWDVADGNGSADDWITEPAAMATYYAGGQLPSVRTLRRRLDHAEAHVGELPGIMMLLWTHAFDATGTIQMRVEARAREIGRRNGAHAALGPDADPADCEHIIDPTFHGGAVSADAYQALIVLRCGRCGLGGRVLTPHSQVGWGVVR